MNVELRFFATFREAVGQKTISREYDEGATVGDVLTALEAEFEGLEGELLDDAGDIRPQLSVLKNGREVLHMAGTETDLESDDTLSVFPPVAGGASDADESSDTAGDGPTTVEKSFRGISKRLATHYLENLGGDVVDGEPEGEGPVHVEGDDWSATLTAEKVDVVASIRMTEVTVTFEGGEETLDELVGDFSQKAMRAGG